MSEDVLEPMYCSECDQMVPENWDPIDERWRCESCGSGLYEDKEEYIEITHATARFEKEFGWGPWYDGHGDLVAHPEGDHSE